jgi:hypothetical protein
MRGNNTGACKATRGKSAVRGGVIPCDLEGEERAFKIAAG